MNDFDNILEQPAEQEAPAQEKPQRKREWWQVKEERQRKEAYATLDRIFHEFSEGRGDVQGYLDTHGRFDRYSARNALLIHEKCPNAKQIGNYQYWENHGVDILKTEKSNPIIILEPGNTYRRKDGSTGQNYYAKEVYDISQTSARGQEQPQVALDERLLLKALIHKLLYRTLPLADDTIQVLNQQRKKVGSSPWVFPSPTGGPISPDSVLHMLHRVLKRAGLPRVRFHDLRHTFATLALQNGVDIKTVSGMLGHFSAGFTLDTYAHVTTAAQKEAAKAMEKVLTAAL